jgi:hypothetical protein
MSQTRPRDEAVAPLKVNATPTKSVPFGSSTADACFEAMIRHAERQQLARTTRLELASQPAEGDRLILSAAGARPPGGREPPGSEPPRDSGRDWLVGAEAISAWVTENFYDCSVREAYRLHEHYGSRPGGPGFFKLKSRVCLSKSRFKEWVMTRIYGSPQRRSGS